MATSAATGERRTAQRLVTHARGPAAASVLAAVVAGIAYADGFYGRGAQAGLAVVCGWTIVLAFTLRVLPLGRVSRTGWVVVAFFASLAVWALVSATWSASAEAAIAEFDRDALYAAVVLLGVALATRTNVVRWVDGIGLGIAAVVVIALASRVFPEAFPDRGLAEFLSSSSTRLSFPLGYWNGLAIFAGLGVPLLLAAALRPRRPALRALALAPLPAVAAVVYLASSRGGVAVAAVGAAVLIALADDRWAALALAVLGAVVSSAVVWAISRERAFVDGPLGTPTAFAQGHRALVDVCVGCAALSFVALPFLGRIRRRPPRALAWTIAAAGLAAGAVGLARMDLAAQWRSFTLPPGDVSYSTGNFAAAHLASGAGNGRWQFWTAAVDQWRAHPLAGNGAGSFPEWWARHAPITYYIRDAHSVFLQMLGELGIVGLLLFVVPLALGLGAGVRRLRGSAAERTELAALVAVVVAWCIGAGIDWMWQLPAVAAVGLVALGVLAGPRDAPIESVTAGRPLRRLVVVAVVALAGALIVVEAAAVAVTMKLRESQVSAGRSDVAAALSAARAARRLEPWAASPYLQLALVEEQSARLGEASRSIQKAIERDPGDWKLRLVEARLLIERGDVAAARRAIATARALAPRTPLLVPGN